MAPTTTTTTPTTTTTTVPPTPAVPTVRRATCIALVGCIAVTVEFEPPDGPPPYRYVIDGLRPGDRDCDLVIDLLDTCIASFTPGTVGTCDYTLRTVDREGRRGPPSAPFCIERIGLG